MASRVARGHERPPAVLVLPLHLLQKRERTNKRNSETNAASVATLAKARTTPKKFHFFYGTRYALPAIARRRRGCDARRTKRTGKTPRTRRTNSGNGRANNAKKFSFFILFISTPAQGSAAQKKCPTQGLKETKNILYVLDVNSCYLFGEAFRTLNH